MRLRFFLLLSLLSPLVGGFADESEGALHELTAPALLVADATTGTVIFSRGDNRLFPPASLAKVMTLYLVQEDMERGAYSPAELVKVPTAGGSDAMRPASSVLGLSAGDRVSILTLMRATAILSAGDAAWTLGLRSSGTIDAFVGRMNRRADRLGMAATRYTDPDGWSATSVTTAGDQLILVLDYIRRFPASLRELHAHEEMVFLDVDNIARKLGGANTNLLIGRVPGVDGLKTGTIPESGFHFVATAARGDQRFIAVVMGIDAGSFYKSLTLRAMEAEQCLEWAFANYLTWRPLLPPGLELPVRHGLAATITPVLKKNPPALTLTKEERSGVVAVINMDEWVRAPIEAGDTLGIATWYGGGELLAKETLVAAESVPSVWKWRDFFKAPGVVDWKK